MSAIGVYREKICPEMMRYTQSNNRNESTNDTRRVSNIQIVPEYEIPKYDSISSSTSNFQERMQPINDSYKIEREESWVAPTKHFHVLSSTDEKSFVRNDECAINDNYKISLKESSKHIACTAKYKYIRDRKRKKNVPFDTKTQFLTRQRNFICWNSHALQVFLILLISTICTSLCHAESDQCAVGLKTPGRTWPQGDIVLEYGQPLRILCILNQTFVDQFFPGKNASDLVFFHNKKEMDSSFLKIMNETTVEMYDPKPLPSEDMYYCKLRLQDDYNVKQHEAVCLNKVVVGFKPQEPQNFTCVSQNWENMHCKWDPVPNNVTTRFTLMFKLPGRAGGRKLYPCPKESQKPLPPNVCIWDTSTNPIYRQPYEYYTFIMNAENVLGNMSVQYRFHHFAHVIPAKPANLSLVNKTADSAMLHWSVPFPMQNFPPGLHHRITYQNQWNFEKPWQVINITYNIHEHKRYYNLVGLEYANTVYDVRVFMKSAVAIGEDKWSEFSDFTFRTPSRLPGLPPRTDVGSFEVTENPSNRDVYLYWQSIPPYLENGDHFKYLVDYVEENGRRLTLLPNETTRTYAKFKGISFNSYRFEIVTSNIVGSNKQKAKIFVPSHYEIPREPIAFTKIAFDHGLYELSWKPPIPDKDIKNYTIFWCDNERDRPYQCTGYLDWVHVPRHVTIYNMTVPNPRKVYQFAISANTERASSGMVWASCTVIHNKVVGKMKSVWINRIGSDLIEVGWSLDCSDRIGIVEGFNIYYCPIVSPYNLNCKGHKLNTTIRADPHTKHGVIYGLKPYTTYMLAVAVLTKSGEGLHSDPLYNTTLEAAPGTPPQDVKIVEVTNTTMFMKWEPPEAMNGVLRYYEVYVNDRSQKVEENNFVELKGLLAHKNYSISVAACTVTCSVKSPAIHRVTQIGVPGKIIAPNVRFMNSSQVMVLWQEPDNPAGNLDYYEIASSDGNVVNSSKTETHISIPDCKAHGRERFNKFRVRGINIAEDGTHLKGPWSESGEGNCYSDGPSYRIWVIIWVIGSLSGIAAVSFLVYSSKRMWLRCKGMREVDVKLPPGLGLAPNMKLLQKIGEQHTRQSSADSSGCSSGQESVTSSLTSESHVSNDSGTEIDSVPISPTAPSWESSTSLRQRNVSVSKPGVTGNAAHWDAYVKAAKSGEPIMSDMVSLARSTPNLTDSTGYTNSQQTWSSTGYISMPSSEELSSNPSPVGKSQIAAGSYCVVGTVPKNEADALAKPVNPYITMASLEHDMRGDSRFNNVNKPKTDTLVSKPYVQTGMIDTFKKSTVQTTLTDSCLKPYVSSFASPPTTGETPSNEPAKSYVTVSSLSKDTGNGTNDCDSKTPYVLTTSLLQLLQGQNNSEADQQTDTEDSDVCENSQIYSSRWNNTKAGSLDPGKQATVIKQASGYVSLGDNPKHEQQSEEQYSKVTVVPSTIQ